MLDNFNLLIEQRALFHGSYIDAITEFVEQNSIDEFEDVVPLLHSIILVKLKTEFIEKNYFPGKKISNNISEFFE